MNSISSLLPVMSSIAMFFQMVLETVSPVQEVVQVEPSLKTSRGAGATGTTSARTRKGVAKTRNATKVFVENIFYLFFFCPVGGAKKGRAVGVCSKEN